MFSILDDSLDLWSVWNKGVTQKCFRNMIYTEIYPFKLGHFRFKGCLMVFGLFIQKFMEHFLNKQWSPCSDTAFFAV